MSDSFGYQSSSYLFAAPRNAPVERLPFIPGRHLDGPQIIAADADEDDIYNDIDQHATAAVLDDPPEKKIHHPRFFSSPEYGSVPIPRTVLSPPSPSEEALSKSPAAMFLSNFSPSAAPAPLPDCEGEEVAGYTLGPIVGTGGFSTIRRASSPTGGVVAIKIVRNADISKQADSEGVRRRLDHEAVVWASLCHEHILPLFSTAHTAYADFFVTLYCPAGSLFDILKRDGRPALLQEDAGMMFRQVVRGIRYLHETAGIVHRDMKLENVLVDEMGVCKIGDFGMSRRIGELDDGTLCVREGSSGHGHGHGLVQSKRNAPAGGLQVMVRARNRSSAPPPSSSAITPAEAQSFQGGSLPYTSPELLLPQTSTTPVGPQPAQDIWALGVMLYALLTGHLPFIDAFEPRLQMKILHGTYDIPSNIGNGAERVLKGCLERSVPCRWSIAAVDEVAWGVSSDDVTPLLSEEEEEEEDVPSLSKPRSQSTSPLDRVRRAAVPIAPVLTTSISTKISNSGPSKQGTYSALTESIRRASFSVSSSSSSSSSSTSSSSSSKSSSRGRRLSKRYEPPASLSPSPSAVPVTPIDYSESHGFDGLVPASPQSSSSTSSPTRSRFGGAPRSPVDLYARPGLKPAQGGTSDEEWSGSEEKGGSNRVDVETRSYLYGEQRPKERRRPSDVGSNHPPRTTSTRPGSTPPVPYAGKEEGGTSALRFSESRGHDGFFRRPELSASSAPIAIPIKGAPRR